MNNPCDCHLWLSLPPGGHHAACRARFRPFDYVILGLLAVAGAFSSVLIAILVALRSV